MIKIDKKLVEQVSWEEDPDTFDLRLHNLGLDHDEFIIVNPRFDPWILNYIDVETVTSDSCVIWTVGNEWAVKKFRNTWQQTNGWTTIQSKIDIKKTIQFNSDVKFINHALRTKIENYNVQLDDINFEHVWYVDPKYVDIEEKIWLAKAIAVDTVPIGIKDMGTLTPQLLFNEDLPKVEYNFNFLLPYYHNDFNYELVWYIDDSFNQEKDKIWLFKFTPDVSMGYKEMHPVSPVIEYNTDIPSIEYDLNLNIPYQDLVYEHTWYLDPKFNHESEKIWAARISPKDSLGTKDMGYISPKIEFNSDIPSVEYDLNLNIPYQDLVYEHVWFLDKRFNHEAEKIWAARIKSKNAQGVKDMGFISPVIEYNTEVPDVEYDLKLNIPYQDLVYEHVWYLDKKLNPGEEDVWVARTKPMEPKGTTNMGYVKPVFKFNQDIPKVEFDLELDLPYYSYDYNYELVWYLNPKFSAGLDSVWVAKLTPKNCQGVKSMGFVSPKLIYNNDLPRLNFYIKEEVPFFDLNYEHVWTVPDDLHTDKEKIWAVKMLPLGQSLGIKYVGDIGVESENFDVVFISYQEPNAEENWQRVLSVAPHAKRITGVKGIFEAHKAAAQLATTRMFYVVDADAQLIDSWRFDYRPNVFDMDCVHLWSSMNPVNNLIYGYGGIKLFPRQLLLDAQTWNIDLTTGLGKLKLINQVSNISAFNYDSFSAFRSAFRECVKLSTSNDPDAVRRLEIWCTVGLDGRNGKYVIDGARAGRQYGLDNAHDTAALKLINDYEWMKKQFELKFSE